jgi:hypothetical protein
MWRGAVGKQREALRCGCIRDACVLRAAIKMFRLAATGSLSTQLLPFIALHTSTHETWDDAFGV